MANNRSSRKRIRINKRNRLQNKFYKSSLRTLIKLFLKDLNIYQNSQNPSDKVKAQNRLNLIYKWLDKGTKNKTFHKNAAARKKSKLSAQLKTF